MNWGQFKKVLDTGGVKDDDEIFYIDVSLPLSESDIDVTFDNCGAQRQLLIGDTGP